MTEKMNYISNNTSDYMSDEELELLITDVEQNELVAAPPDMLEKILDRIREGEEDAEMVSNVKNISSKQNTKQVIRPVTNIREFRRYCFKVCASVAAAIVLVFALPVISENSLTNTTRQEPFIKESRYATKEEALNDQSYLVDKLGNTNIFSKEHEIGIFNGKREDEK